MINIPDEVFQKIWEASNTDLITLTMDLVHGRLRPGDAMDKMAEINQMFYQEGYNRGIHG